MYSGGFRLVFYKALFRLLTFWADLLYYILVQMSALRREIPTLRRKYL